MLLNHESLRELFHIKNFNPSVNTVLDYGFFERQVK